MIFWIKKKSLLSTDLLEISNKPYSFKFPRVAKWKREFVLTTLTSRSLLLLLGTVSSENFRGMEMPGSIACKWVCGQRCENMFGLETCQFGGRKRVAFLLPYVRIIEKKNWKKKKLYYCARSETRGCRNWICCILCFKFNQQLPLYVAIEPRESTDEKIIRHPNEEMLVVFCGSELFLYCYIEI